MTSLPTRISILILAIVAGSIFVYNFDLRKTLSRVSSVANMNDDEGHHDRQLQLMLENDPKTVQLRHPSLYNAYYSEKEDGGLTLKSDADSEMTPLAPRPRIQPDLLLPNVLLIGA